MYLLVPWWKAELSGPVHRNKSSEGSGEVEGEFSEAGGRLMVGLVEQASAKLQRATGRSLPLTKYSLYSRMKKKNDSKKH